MTEAEAPYRGTVVGTYAALLGVEAHTLADDGGLGARAAPYRIGHLEADGLGVAVAAGGLLVMKLVAGRGPFQVRRDITSHVEALHLAMVDAVAAVW